VHDVGDAERQEQEDVGEPLVDRLRCKIMEASILNNITNSAQECCRRRRKMMRR
jgi:hypothetical protein